MTKECNHEWVYSVRYKDKPNLTGATYRETGATNFRMCRFCRVKQQKEWVNLNENTPVASESSST